MNFQVIFGDLKDVCMPSTFKFCQSGPSSPISVASERREHSPWNSEDKQGLLPDRVVSLKHCWLHLTLIWLLLAEIWGKLAFRDTSKIVLMSVNIHSTDIIWTPTLCQALFCVLKVQ